MQTIDVFAEACRRMAIEEFRAADRARAVAGHLVRLGGLLGGATAPAYSEATERDSVGDVYAWFAEQASTGTACTCRAPRPCPEIQGRDLLKLPRVTYLTTIPGEWLEVPGAWKAAVGTRGLGGPDAG
jgi:hypothetical protein